MYAKETKQAGEATSQERRNPAQPSDRSIGHVVRCDGSTASISFSPSAREAYASLTVGKLITIQTGKVRTVAFISAIEHSSTEWQDDATKPVTLSVELVGEVRDIDMVPTFDRGITEYPYIGAIAHNIRLGDLRAVYDLGGTGSIRIGSLSQDAKVDAMLAVDDVLSRHFAIVGTTGVGKSAAVTLLLRKLVQARTDLSVLLFDPHNEFASALPEYCVRLDADSLELPFWLFRFEELVEVLYRGRGAPPEEMDLLRDLVVHAKNLFREPSSVVRRRVDSSGITADTPVPYRMADLLREIDNRIGALDAKVDRPHFRQLRLRLESAISDPLYRFMFTAHVGDETLHETIGRIFRVPHEGRPITCFEMAGLPGEVVNAVCSVLARLAFDVAMLSDGRIKILMMCEEAHRYIPSDTNLGFAPTRHALARIAREGRKYGCHLGVITQRPGDLDPTVLSQCSTIFAMRLANEADQAIIRSATADASASILAFLPALGQREAIAFGEGVATTMRLRFEKIDDAFLPGKGKESQATRRGMPQAQLDMRLIVEKMRRVSVRTPDLSVRAASINADLPEERLLPGGSSFFTR